MTWIDSNQNLTDIELFSGLSSTDKPTHADWPVECFEISIGSLQGHMSMIGSRCKSGLSKQHLFLSITLSYDKIRWYKNNDSVLDQSEEPW